MSRITVKHKDVGDDLYKSEYLAEEAHEIPDETILIVSEPPSGYYKIYNIYAQKIGAKYHIVTEQENVPEP